MNNKKYLQEQSVGGAMLFMLIFATSVIFFYVMFGLASTGNTQFNQYILSTNYLGAFGTVIVNALFSVSGVLGIIGIAAGTVFFPNPYTLFAGIAGVFYSIMSTISSDVLGGQNALFNGYAYGYINTIITILLIIGLLDWFKGARQA